MNHAHSANPSTRRRALPAVVAQLRWLRGEERAFAREDYKAGSARPTGKKLGLPQEPDSRLLSFLLVFHFREIRIDDFGIVTGFAATCGSG